MEVWTSHQGLPHNSVNAITQTDDGYLWFATWEGVARYNGLSFELFSRDVKTGIADAGIRTLVADQQNRLWIGGARGGLTLHQDFSWYPQALAKSLINHVLVDHESNLWLAVEGEGVFFRPYLGNNEYGNGRQVLDVGAYRLVQATNGVIYAATSAGVYRVSQTNAEQLSIPSVPDKTRIYYVASDHQDELLIASAKGAWRFDGNTFSPVAEELSGSVVTLIEEDDEGTLWLGTLDKGLARVGYRQVDYIDTQSGLPNNRVISWFQDVEGSIWVGTNGGILRLRTAPFQSVDEQAGLLGNFVRTVLQVPGERFLVGSSEGLSLLEDGQAFPASDDLVARQSVLSLAALDSGDALVGTQRSGVYEWRMGKMRQLYSQGNGLPANEVRALLEDSKGRRWIGTVNGLVLVESDGSMTQINQHNSDLPDDYIMALMEDHRGRIWIGTAQGVAFYDRRNQIKQIDISTYEGAQYVFGFYIEPGFIWMATDRGLLRYDAMQNTLSGIGKPAGLPIDKFFQVIYDHMGSFWLSSNRGIWKVGYVEAHRVASGERHTVNFEHFGEEDGMGSSQANGGSNPAAVSSRGGNLVFATANGIALIRPTALKQLYQYRLPVVVEEVDADGVKVNPKIDKQLGAGVNRVRIKFAGLSYIMPQRLQYQTKLVGFEEEWNYHGNQTVAEYTNLPPGHYEFLVSARYPYGEWNATKHSLKFEIEPLLWQRKDAQLLASLGLLFSIGSLMYWRVHSLKSRQRELAQQVRIKTQALREQSEQYERLAKEDPLTGLYNRRAFDERVRRDFMMASQSLRQLNMAIVDIDHFKQVNDRFSHLVGDEVIKLVAHYLQYTVQPPNIVARWGGEEFTLLIHGDEEEAEKFCQKLLVGVSQLECEALHMQFNLTVSIGLSNALGCSDYQTLLKRADQALYEAKEAGRNRVVKYQEFRIY
ncbi:ligand-binding sensor domain-containing diguanylate cyclase [Marinomonas aquimarina]|nr:ligand-binding sensor domain-containing diguanylate cyclase [Marinomonas aquimarina]